MFNEKLSLFWETLFFKPVRIFEMHFVINYHENFIYWRNKARLSNTKKTN